MGLHQDTDLPHSIRAHALAEDQRRNRLVLEVGKVAAAANASGSKPRDFGEFSVAFLNPGIADDAGHVQIRAPNLVEPGDVEFRFPLPVTGDVTIPVRECAEELLAAAKLFHQTIGALPVDQLREAAARMTGRTRGSATALGLLAIGITPPLPMRAAIMTLDIATLGEDLTYREQRVMGADMGELEQQLADMVSVHLRRDQLRSRLLARDAIGLLDGAALRAITAAGFSKAEVAQALSTQSTLYFTFHTSTGEEVEAGLHWVDGTVKAELRPFSRAWSFESDCLRIADPGLPDTIVDAWKGRAIGDIIEQEFIPPDAVVAEHPDRLGGSIYVDLEIPVVDLPPPGHASGP